MTTKEFKAIKSNASAVIGAECKFNRFYPSCDKYVIERGFIAGFSEGVYDRDIIIAQMGRRIAIHYTGVTIIK